MSENKELGKSGRNVQSLVNTLPYTSFTEINYPNPVKVDGRFGSFTTNSPSKGLVIEVVYPVIKWNAHSQRSP